MMQGRRQRARHCGNLRKRSLKSMMEFKTSMSQQFEMSDLGILTYYLGIEVNQNSKGIEIKQEA